MRPAAPPAGLFHAFQVIVMSPRALQALAAASVRARTAVPVTHPAAIVKPPVASLARPAAGVLRA